MQFDGSVPFTQLVEQAWQQGLTEPDPRVDLSGQDVMRKLVILAREAGYAIEPNQLRVESLVAPGREAGSVDHLFEEGGAALNEHMQQRLEAANEMGLVGWCCAILRVSRLTARSGSACRRCGGNIRWPHCYLAIMFLL